MADITKTKSAEVVLTQAQFTAMQTAGTLQEGVAYHISDYQEPVQDVKINTTSILSSGVATIPLATTSVDGAMSTTQVTKLDGIETGAQVNTVTSVDGDTGAVVLSDVKYTSQSLTSEQKTQARTNISAITLEEYNSSAASYNDGTLYYVVED